jgi:integrase
MASLRRFSGTRYWYACFRGADSRRVQRSTGEIDRRRAQKIADTFEQAAFDARRGLLVERAARKVIGEIYSIATRETLRSDTIEDFFKRWLERVKIESHYKTHQRYASITKRFIDWLGPRAQLGIAHLSSVDIVHHRDFLARQHSPATVNTSLAAIQSALSRAFDDGLVDVNECSRVPRLEDDPAHKTQRRAFTPDELRAIIAVCDPEWRGMVLVGAYTGARLGDISLLRWENVDLSTRELRFTTEKTNRAQVVPISEVLHRHLLDIASSDDARAALFPRAFASRQRRVLTGALSNQFYRIMVRAGVVAARDNKSQGKGRSAARTTNALGFHSLRHYMTSQLKMSGASDSIAREIVGHESAAVSRIYSHIDMQTLRIAVDRIPDVIKPGRE